MTFPIYHCDKLLFRDGAPAMSLDCCCDYYLCCGDCFFPVGPGVSSPNPFEDTGGPTRIENLRIEATYSGPFPCADGETFLDSPFIANQIGPSTHLVSFAGFQCFPGDEDNDQVGLIVKFSRCEFRVPHSYKNMGNPLCPGDEYDDQIIMNIRYMGGGIWNFGSGVGSLNTTGGCEGTISHTITYPPTPPGTLSLTVVTTWDVIREFPPGKSAADYECPSPGIIDAITGNVGS
jgi:hypothetical protein